MILKWHEHTDYLDLEHLLAIQWFLIAWKGALSKLTVPNGDGGLRCLYLTQNLPCYSNSPGSVTPSSLKNFRHLEYIYVNVLYISEAYHWSDKHTVSCLFARYTWLAGGKSHF